ncbi:MAG: ribosomal RNA small subunit methyltransferase H [Pirellulaceae bacterium]|nr:MAG: ribosomal RNA small subunit methyltransferase H [Pirellulaceae bacterium]
MRGCFGSPAGFILFLLRAVENITSQHVPVLPELVEQYGNFAPGQKWIDGTAGGGGHTRLIAQAVGDQGAVLAVDRDPQAVDRLHRSDLPSQVVIRQGSYADVDHWLTSLGWEAVDGILLDLGLSSDQLADTTRGFSFQTEGDLDMRFDSSVGEPAWEWLQRVDERHLADVIFQYGEERFSRRIARRIIEARRTTSIRTAAQLREIIYAAVPRGRKVAGGGRRHGRVDPATRTFQALRIAVNDELGELRRALSRLPDLLGIGGRLLIISFHSLEDRMVKHAMRDDPRLQVITKKPIRPSDQEIVNNPRSRSAKMRVAERVQGTPQDNGPGFV